MSARAIIAAAAAEGVRLSLAPNGTVIAAGDRAAVERWLPDIRKHKAGVLLALQEAAKDRRGAESAVVAEPVRCANCVHFQPGVNPLRGRCGAGVTLAPLAWHQRGERLAVGSGDPELWATDARACVRFASGELIAAVRAMAERWAYDPDDLAWALEQAAADPEGWRELIEADLAGRRWPGGEGWQEGGL